MCLKDIFTESFKYQTNVSVPLSRIGLSIRLAEFGFTLKNSSHETRSLSIESFKDSRLLYQKF